MEVECEVNYLLLEIPILRRGLEIPYEPCEAWDGDIGLDHGFPPLLGGLVRCDRGW